MKKVVVKYIDPTPPLGHGPYTWEHVCKAAVMRVEKHVVKIEMGDRVIMFPTRVLLWAQVRDVDEQTGKLEEDSDSMSN